MTHIRGGIEYLDSREMKIWKSVRYLNEQGRTTNNSQIAADTGISRTTVGFITSHLRAREFLRDVSKGTAYHWRADTGKIPREQPSEEI